VRRHFYWVPWRLVGTQLDVRIGNARSAWITLVDWFSLEYGVSPVYRNWAL
jgi:hypothetical protein